MKQKKFQDEDEDESKFNMAVASLKRIHNGLLLCSQCSFQQSPMDWVNALDIVYRELSPLLTPEEEEEVIKKQNFIESKKGVYISLTSMGKTSNGFPRLLRDYEVCLRKIMHKNKLDYPTKKSILDFADKLD